jgi:hypothetical protein
MVIPIGYIFLPGTHPRPIFITDVIHAKGVIEGFFRESTSLRHKVIV